MRLWNLDYRTPIFFTLAADARFGEVDYVNDQIWEFSFGGGEPRALSIQTTFGLRAKSMRIFPRFTQGNMQLIDPHEFHVQPKIIQFFPNFLFLSFSPFPKIDAVVKFLVPDSSSIVAQFSISNNSDTQKELIVEWLTQLSPNDGQPMAPTTLQASPILAGKTGPLSPVFFLTGGPQPGRGSYPSLELHYQLPVRNQIQNIWAHAALESKDLSFEKVRNLATINWNAEFSRHQLRNSGQLEIYTGDQSWDLVFALSLKQGNSLLINATNNLSNSSFVLNRRPDQGYSMSGDGSDYNHLWNGQSPLETHYLCQFLLPSSVNITKGLLGNFLENQLENGFIDWKPGLGGQRSNILATPILSTIAWEIYNYLEDPNFLSVAFPKLLQFNEYWLSSENDKDDDGIPEWSHLVQTGIEEHPIYSHWQNESLGVDIKTAEGPDLCSFLYKEYSILLRIAQILKEDKFIPSIEENIEKLQNAIHSFWHPKFINYVSWDRDTHAQSAPDLLLKTAGPGVITLNQKLYNPSRFFIRITTSDETKISPDLYIHGTGFSGNERVEHITSNEFKWNLGRGQYTGSLIYTSVERVEFKNLGLGDEIELFSTGYECNSQGGLLPLWANAIDETYASTLIKNSIIDENLFWKPYGIPLCVKSGNFDSETICTNVHLPLNAMIGEGLLNYDKRETAALLLIKLMNAITQTLNNDHSFRSFYNSETGLGSGERNTINSLAPLRLFLETVGIKILSQEKVITTGYNPFDWPVKIKYKGITVTRQGDKSHISFPDGQSVDVDGTETQIISLN